MPPVLQYCSSPARHSGHSRQESTKQPTPTRSPGLNLVTELPTSRTTPAISCPGTRGKVAGPHSSRAVWMSEWQIPAYWTSKSTSCGPGSRLVIVTFSNGAVGELTE